ncbi:MAG TPA: tRNA lysidine(34) synthetase TilS [Gemmatimonadales bacterium]|nr:tRNA lysidine(34) synthetase TilS [Gemmatimonadales bacterium]
MTLGPRLLAALAATDLAQPGRRALVAVSGGADSVALLDLLVATRSAHGLDLVAAHVDHGIHPDSATVADAVAELAGRLGVPLVRGRLRLGGGAGETVARLRRHRWLESARRRARADCIVLAHHADDQAETVLMRMLRGSGPAGLAGIRPVRGRLVRPLLGTSRAELRAHCAARGLPWWDDPANADPAHLRSWLRGNLLPAIRARVPTADAALLRVAAAAADDSAAWDAALDLLPGLAPRGEPGGASVVAAVLAGYDSELARAVVRGLARRAGCPLGPARAARVVAWAAGAVSGGSLPLGGPWLAELAFARLHVVRRPAAPPPAARLDGVSGELAWGAWRLSWRMEPAPTTQPRDGWIAWVIPGGVTLRSCMAGDRLHPLGGLGRRLVVREMQDRQVPRSRRAGWPVLVREAEVLWVPGVCRAAAAVPVEGTDALRVDVAHA